MSYRQETYTAHFKEIQGQLKKRRKGWKSLDSNVKRIKIQTKLLIAYL